MYEVVLESRAEHDLRRLPATMFARIIQAVQGLAQNPRPPGCRKIVGSQNDWRIRVGDYRVIFEIVEKENAVRVMRVRHRREAYRK